MKAVIVLPVPSSTASAVNCANATVKDQLGALGLVVNAVVLWNTRYIERALKQLEQIGLAVRPEDVERIWPLGFQHINMLGRYSFDLPEQLTRGELRSLRDPSEATDQEVLVA